MVRIRVGSVIAFVMLFLLGLNMQSARSSVTSTATSIRAQTPGYAGLPDELARRIASIGQEATVLVRVGMPLLTSPKIAVPDGWNVIGSYTRIAGAAADGYMYLDAPMISPLTALTTLAKSLGTEGWVATGVREAPLNAAHPFTVKTEFFCVPGVELEVVAAQETKTLDPVRVSLHTSAAKLSPCNSGGGGVIPAPDGTRLVLPKTAQPIPNNVLGTGDQLYYAQRESFESDKSPAELEALTAGQLMATGWDRVALASSDAAAISTWQTLQNAVSLQATLSVVRAVGTESRRDLFIVVSRAAGQSFVGAGPPGFYAALQPAIDAGERSERIGELTARIADPSGFGRRVSRVFPESVLPVTPRLAIPSDWRVVGSYLSEIESNEALAVSKNLRNAGYTFADLSGSSPTDAIDALSVTLVAAGWTKTSTGPIPANGFVPQRAMKAFGAFCVDGVAVSAIASIQATSPSVGVVLRASPLGTTPCLQQAAVSPNPLRFPTVVLPDTVTVVAASSLRLTAQDAAGVGVTVASDDTPSVLETKFGSQLESDGWQRLSLAEAESAVVSMWRKSNESTPLQCTLTVTKAIGGDRRKDLLLTVSRRVTAYDSDPSTTARGQIIRQLNASSTTLAPSKPAPKPASAKTTSRKKKTPKKR